MTRSAKVAQQPGAIPVDTFARDSPTDATVPFWITACVRLQPPRRRNGAEITASLANAVFPAVQALIADRLRTEGDAKVPLDRDRLARRCGLGDAKKATWMFDYLSLIGFLQVTAHYRGVGRGRVRDTFVVSIQPPLNYVGPRTHAELERALDDPDRPLAKTLFIGDSAGQAQGSESRTYSSDQGAQSGTLVGDSAGQAQGSESRTYSSDQGAQSGTLVGDSAGQAQGSESASFSIDRSSISEREIEGSTEPGTGRAAQPPAPGIDDVLRAEVREAVRSFPINAWWQHHGKDKIQKSQVLSEADTSMLLELIVKAMSTVGITLEQVRVIGQAAVSEANSSPVKYLEGAFGPNLRKWLGRSTPEPAAKHPLPLLIAPKLQAPAARSSSKKAAPAIEGDQAQFARLGEDERCPQCGATADTEMGDRLVLGADGREMFCPRCKPRRVS